MSQVTQLLTALQAGDPRAADELLPLVYDELRRLARARLTREAADQSLQPTELVHEAYLRLVGSQDESGWNGRSHFFGAAAEAMRRILVDRARKRKAQKHGGNHIRVPLGDNDVPWHGESDDRILLLDHALSEFEAYDSQKARYVKLRYFAGLTNLEAAQAVGVSAATGNRYWVFARAWLQKAITEQTS